MCSIAFLHHVLTSFYDVKEDVRSEKQEKRYVLAPAYPCLSARWLKTGGKASSAGLPSFIGYSSGKKQPVRKRGRYAG
jgi:hypothetical protein